MTLTDEQVERWSRQILLPEVGGRGQARLLAARASVAGSGEAAGVAATLLERAGVGRLDLIGDGPAPPVQAVPDAAVPDAAVPDVAVAVAAEPALAAVLGRRAQAAGRPFVLGTLDGDTARVLTLVGRPCVACVPTRWLETTGADGVLAAPLALALGALAASEALQALLASPSRGRAQAIGLGAGVPRAIPLEAASSCSACGGTA